MKYVFGEKISNLDYRRRIGVYAIIFNIARDEVLTVQTSNGHYFLPGVIHSYIGNAFNYHKSLKGVPSLMMVISISSFNFLNA